MANIKVLTDNFDDNSIDTSKWSEYESNATVSEVNQRIEITPDPATAGADGSLYSSDNYDLTGGHVLVKVEQILNASVNTILYVSIDADNKLMLFTESGTIYAKKIVGGTPTNVASTTYDNSAMLWWRIREAGGVTFWEYSADSIVWNALHSENNPITLTSIDVGLEGNEWQSEASPGTAIFDSFNIPARKSVMRRLLYKVYQPDGTFVTTLNEVVSEFEVVNSINGGQGQLKVRLARPFDGYNDDSVASYNNVLKVFVFDDDNPPPNGKQIYTGYLVSINPVVHAYKEYVELIFLGAVSKLMNDFFRSGDSLTITKTTVDPSQIIKDIIDNYKASVTSPIVDYNGTIDATGTTINYTFDRKKHLEAIRRTMEFFPSDWYFFVNGEGDVEVHQQSSSADHKFTLGKDLRRVTTNKTIENVVNYFIFWNGKQSAESDYIWSKYEDVTSQSNYEVHADFHTDSRVTQQATADKKGNLVIASQKDPKVKATILIGSDYDLVSIAPGQTCKLLNIDIDDPTFDDNMKIVKVTYGVDWAEIELAEFQADNNKLAQDDYDTLSYKVDDLEDRINEITIQQLNFTPLESSAGKDDIIATINASSEGLNITADRINISGATTFSSGYDPSEKIADSDYGTGGSYASAASGARVQIFPSATIGIRVYDDAASVVFQVNVGGTAVGDVSIGNYAGNQGAKWDKSAGTFIVKGEVQASSGSFTGTVTTSNLSADGGTIAGWSISSSELSSNNARLGSDGYLALGTGDDVVKLSSVDVTYRLWVGASTGVSAPFRVTKAGVLTATNANVTGTITTSNITATGGTVGGWTIDSESIYSGNMMISTNSTLGRGVIRVGVSGDEGGINEPDSATSDVIFWAGETLSNRKTAPFHIWKDGATYVSDLTADGGTITGATIKSTAGNDRIELTTGNTIDFYKGGSFAGSIESYSVGIAILPYDGPEFDFGDEGLNCNNGYIVDVARIAIGVDTTAYKFYLYHDTPNQTAFRVGSTMAGSPWASIEAPSGQTADILHIGKNATTFFKITGAGVADFSQPVDMHNQLNMNNNDIVNCEQLEMDDVIKLGVDCVTEGSEGASGWIYYSTATNTIRLYASGAWRSVDWS